MNNHQKWGVIHICTRPNRNNEYVEFETRDAALKYMQDTVTQYLTGEISPISARIGDDFANLVYSYDSDGYEEAEHFAVVHTNTAASRHESVSMQTPLGLLSAITKGGYPDDYPGIEIALNTNGKELCLAWVEYDNGKGCMQVVSYGNNECDEPTHIEEIR